jgi:hypothetical protein
LTNLNKKGEVKESVVKQKRRSKAKWQRRFKKRKKVNGLKKRKHSDCYESKKECSGQ